MSPSLPEFWVKSKLSEISSGVSTNGKKVKTQDVLPLGKYKVIDQGASESPGFLNDEARVIQATKDSPVILFGDHTRAVKYIDHDFIPGADGTKLLRAKAGINPRYLRYLVESADIPDRGYSRHFQYLNAAEFPVAPAAEQIRIANQLDTLLTRIQSCNDRFDAIPALLKRFRQAVCTEATTGPWKPTTIGAVSVDLRYGTSKKCDYAATGTGVLRIPNIAERGRIDVVDLKRAEFDANEIQKLTLVEGDLLVIRSNGSVELVGKTGLVTADESGLLFAGYLMRLRVDRTKAIPAFVQLCLSAPLQRQYIERTAKSTSGVNNLNAQELRSLPMLLPPLAEQIEITNRVDALFALADRIEARANAARTHAQRLTPLVLAKAFRGELVPQDPNDEPASTLLTRVASPKTAVAGKNKRKVPAAHMGRA